MTTFEMDFGTSRFEMIQSENTYRGTGNKCIQIHCREIGQQFWEPFGRLTVNVEGVKLQSNEILVKNWSENEGWAEAVARKLGYIKTTRYVRTGFVEAFIWEKV